MNLQQSLLSTFILFATALPSLAQEKLAAPDAASATRETIAQFEAYVANGSREKARRGCAYEQHDVNH